jgi:hypothetical protein
VGSKQSLYRPFARHDRGWYFKGQEAHGGGATYAKVTEPTQFFVFTAFLDYPFGIVCADCRIHPNRSAGFARV